MRERDTLLRMLVHELEDLASDPDAYLVAIPDWCDPVGDLVNELAPRLESVSESAAWLAIAESDRTAIESFRAAFFATIRAHPPDAPFWTVTSFKAHADWSRLRLAARELLTRFPDYRSGERWVLRGRRDPSGGA